MVLTELTRSMEMPRGIPQANPLSSEFMQYLNNNGWSKSGQGYFSNVYTNPNYSFVMKVNQRYDRGFANFAILTHKHPNKHFPVIGNAKLIRSGDSKYHIYLIERLQPLDNRYWDIIEKLAYTFGYDRIKTVDDVVEYVAAVIVSNMKYDSFPDLTPKQIEEDKAYYLDQWEKFKNANIGLIEAMSLVQKSKHGSLDFKPSNFMQREDGTIVITDPIAGM